MVFVLCCLSLVLGVIFMLPLFEKVDPADVKDSMGFSLALAIFKENGFIKSVGPFFLVALGFLVPVVLFATSGLR